MLGASDLELAKFKLQDMASREVEPYNHYEMPSGLHVKEVSRYLTSNGGQAVQYVARSSRLDGKVKGSLEDRKKDLRKAIDFINDELERLEALGND